MGRLTGANGEDRRDTGSGFDRIREDDRVLSPIWVMYWSRNIHGSVPAAGEEYSPIHLSEDCARPCQKPHMIIAKGCKLGRREEVVTFLLNDSRITVAKGIAEVFEIE